ncbi:hypothetical protein [Pseudomonas sp. NPDC089569]|uniref:hypothetical protein n=1 Tax=Pseudomonas sp. NPDC089569 TaxID=3390722 RepID=UPI003D00457C
MGIDITIVAGADAVTSWVRAGGEVVDVISDAERETFGINDERLKDCVNKYFGRAPNGVYLKSPTPGKDLYTIYGWPEVKRVMKVQSAEVLGITSEPVIVKSQDFVNNSSRPATFDVAITDSVAQSISSSWRTGGKFKVEQKFVYKVGFLGSEAGGESTISYQQSWGIGGEQSRRVSVGSNADVKVQLEPGERVTATLSASRGVMKVRVRYVACLEGIIALNYDPTHRDHHFWGLDIGAVMAVGGVSNAVTSTEDIEIGYYANSRIELKDKASGITRLQ